MIDALHETWPLFAAGLGVVVKKCGGCGESFVAADDETAPRCPPCVRQAE